MGSIIFNVANENVANPTQQLLAEPAIVDMHADGETTVSSECSHVCQRFDTAGSTSKLEIASAPPSPGSRCAPQITVLHRVASAHLVSAQPQS
jgi:hypothetical protein